jgi:hypothetical protein
MATETGYVRVAAVEALVKRLDEERWAQTVPARKRRVVVQVIRPARLTGIAWAGTGWHVNRTEDEPLGYLRVRVPLWLARWMAPWLG